MIFTSTDCLDLRLVDRIMINYLYIIVLIFVLCSIYIYSI